MTFLQKVGELIIVSILWLVCSLPIVTFGASCTALYYATVKSIRKDRGYAAKEFFRSFKRNLKSGSILTIIFLAIAAVLFYNREYLGAVAGGNEAALASGFLSQGDGATLLFYIVYDGILILMAAISIYLFPVLSRFDMKIADIVKLSFVMSIRYFYITIALAAGLAILVFLQWKYLPIPTIVIIPGVWAFASSYLVEKAMKKYMGEAKPGEDAWYLEL